MKTYYVVAERFFHEGRSWTKGTYELTCNGSTGLCSETLEDLRDQINKQMQAGNREIAYCDSCIITFIHEMES